MVRGRYNSLYCALTRNIISMAAGRVLPNCSLLSPLHIPLRRRLSTHQAFAHSPYAIVQATEVMLESVHHHTHLPWWVVIVGTTVILRASVTLPLAIYQAKMVTKQELLLPRLKELQGVALHNIVVRCRRANLPHTEANKKYRKEVVHGRSSQFHDHRITAGQSDSRKAVQWRRLQSIYTLPVAMGANPSLDYTVLFSP